MAFALTKYQAWPELLSTPIWKRARQFVELKITATVNDVALDIGTDAGTFWTAAQANATYGTLATSALAAIKQITGACDSLVRVGSEQLLDRLQAAAAAGTSYTLAIADHRPNITFAAGQGETAFTILLEWSLPDGNVGYKAQFGS